MRDIRVATVQFQHAPGDRAYNLERIRHFTAEAVRARAEIVAFPEMCVAGYWHLRKLPRPPGLRSGPTRTRACSARGGASQQTLARKS